MTVYLFISAIIIFACVIFNKISSKLGIPTLLAFIILGMFFGSDGLVKIQFDNYSFAEQICSVALIFIMFYGGFGTKWNQAKPIAAKAIVLSSIGTVVTAALVGVFCHYILKIALWESFLIGSVISSTDAASVFSILRSKRLNLRYNTASLLEIESGSNDPFSYMLTVIVLSLMNDNVSVSQFSYLLFAQIVFGVAFGILIAAFAWLIFKNFKFSAEGFDAIFLVAVAIISYSLPSFWGGNGYLSVYITGIILGNLEIKNKQSLVHFFDGTTGLMQMILFFLLGLLSFPSQLPGVALSALGIALFLTFIARPIAVFCVLTPFRSNLKQQLLVAWSGMRGAASIVFAIMVVINPATTDNDIFHIVFFIVLFSILLQGTLIPWIAKFLKMTDDKADVMKTFTDYIEEIPVQFIQFTLSSSHSWVGKAINEIVLPPDSLLVLLIRDNHKIVPTGKTILLTGDTLILSGNPTDKIEDVHIHEKTIEKGDKWINQKISHIESDENLIILIKRNGRIFVPKGSTTLIENDIIVINEVKASI